MVLQITSLTHCSERHIPLKANPVFGFFIIHEIVVQIEAGPIQRQLVAMASKKPISAQSKFLAVIVDV